jgi:hypothetical protein
MGEAALVPPAPSPVEGEGRPPAQLLLTDLPLSAVEGKVLPHGRAFLGPGACRFEGGGGA